MNSTNALLKGRKDKVITEKEYYQMLGSLPPAISTGNSFAFLVGEATRSIGNDLLYGFYYISDEKYYYGGLITIKTFKILFNI